MAVIQSAEQRLAKEAAGKAGAEPATKKAPAKGKKADAPVAKASPAAISGPIIPGVRVLQASPRSSGSSDVRRAALAALASLKGDLKSSYIDKDHQEILVPTGSIVLDGVLGLGGFPLENRLIHMQGEEHSGKSTIFFSYLGNYQRIQHEPVVFLDYEGCTEPKYLRECGVNTDDGNIFTHRPRDFDDALRLCKMYAGAGIKVFMFDSVPKMIKGVDGKTVDKGQAMDVRPGEHAAAFKQFLNALSCHTRGCQLLFVNQIRDLIATTMRDQARVKYQTIDKPAYVVPGGRALKFAINIGLEAMKGKTFDKVSEDDEWLFPEISTDPEKARVWGINRTALRVMKNKSTSGGYRAYHLYTRPGMGVDDNISIRELAKAYDLIRGNSKGWVVGRDGEANIAEYRNKDAALQALVCDEDPRVLQALKEMLFQVIFEEDAKRFRYEQTARDKFLAGDIEASEARALGVIGATDFEAETPGTTEMDIPDETME